MRSCHFAQYFESHEIYKSTLAVEEAPTETEPKFNPFTGVARRLDGKPLKNQPAPPASSSGLKDEKPDVANGRALPSTGSSSQTADHQSQGKLVFGSNVNRTPKDAQKVVLYLSSCITVYY